MSIATKGSRAAAAGLGALALVAATTMGHALADGGSISGCVGKDSRQLRIPKAGEGCKNNEEAISWNSAGAKGDKGDPGPAGPTGAEGADGRDGVDGLNGLDGRDGIDGQNGADGAVGPMGPRGFTGFTGATGPQGPQGPPGPAGAASSYAGDVAFTQDLNVSLSGAACAPSVERSQTVSTTSITLPKGTYQVLHPYVRTLRATATGALAQITAQLFRVTANGSVPLNQGFWRVSSDGTKELPLLFLQTQGSETIRADFTGLVATCGEASTTFGGLSFLKIG